MRSPFPDPRRSRSPRGLTLLEILIVIGILVLILGLGVAGFDRIGGVRLRNETNRVAAAVRFTFNRAVSLGLYMRMVIDLDGESYTVEASETPTFLRERKPGDDDAQDDPDAPAADSKSSRGRGGDDAAASAAKASERRARFVKDDVIGTQKLEGGAAFDGVTVAGQSDPTTSGKAYIHFFPNGWAEPAVIHTTDGEGTYFTLQVNPLTGKVTNKPGKIDPPREFGEPERVEEEGE